MELNGNKISEQLRFALKTSELSLYRVSQETGIDEGTLSKFRRGQIGLGLNNVDVLAKYLRLRLTRANKSGVAEN